jgi:hypothetical protein
MALASWLAIAYIPFAIGFILEAVDQNRKCNNPR